MFALSFLLFIFIKFFILKLAYIRAHLYNFINKFFDLMLEVKFSNCLSFLILRIREN